MSTPVAQPKVTWLALSALGVVYGDIGTSPLYALRECVSGVHGVEPTRDAVLGLLSLITWSLVLVVVVKYLVLLLSADNGGEGGVLALLALVIPHGERHQTGKTPILLLLGLFGAALLFGDGAITPAISVLSAVEGLEVVAPAMHHLVVPITLAILVGLFLVQSRGTGKLGAVLGPVMLLWFVTIGVLGVQWIAREPAVLQAANPWHALRFLGAHGASGFLVLGAVVLCITGAEALYADMGHFGKRPIRWAWLTLVFPALLCNYYGQGAMLLRDGNAHANPFFAMAPESLRYPLLALATLATVIASQALITGVFSLTRQAMQLGFLPRFNVVHTSGATEGQIYIPEINALLAVVCVFLVLGFRSSSALAAAYGIAVTGTMAITSLLYHSIGKQRFGVVIAGGLTALFLTIDLGFLSANAVKLFDGAFVPILIAIAICTVMLTWRRGQQLLKLALRSTTPRLGAFIAEVEKMQLHRVPGTAVFMASENDTAPRSLLHFLKHVKALHERVVLLSIQSVDVPVVAADERVVIERLAQGFVRVTGTFGFMQTPVVADVLKRCREHGLEMRTNDTSFFLGRLSLVPTNRSTMARWRKLLFAFLRRNERSATSYYDLPLNQVIELGYQIDI